MEMWNGTSGLRPNGWQNCIPPRVCRENPLPFLFLPPVTPCVLCCAPFLHLHSQQWPSSLTSLSPHLLQLWLSCCPLWDYRDPRQWDYSYFSPLLIYCSPLAYSNCVIPLAKLSVITSVLRAETQSNCMCCILLDPSASPQAKRAGAAGCPCCFLYLPVETPRTQTSCTFFKIHEIITSFINCKRRKYQTLMGIWTLFLSSLKLEYLY